MSERYLRPRICLHTDLRKPLRVEKERIQRADHESDISVSQLLTAMTLEVYATQQTSCIADCT
jgi:hypothetical protein